MTFMRLFVVVGFALDDGAGAVDLFCECEANHLVREGHSRERELLVGALIDSGGETVWASNDEDEASGGLLFLFQPACKLDAAELSPVFVEKYNGVRGLQLF